MVRRIYFDVLVVKGFKVKFEDLEKSIWVLEKSWKVLKFVSEKGNEAWQQVSFTKVTTFKALYACKVVQVDFFWVKITVFQVFWQPGSCTVHVC